jgi:ankyrin repeat protein
MKAIQAILVTIWGALVVIPSFTQETHLRTLAATATAQEIREALRYSSEVNKRDASGVSTPMLAAGSNHDAGVIAVLINAGADINLRNRSGESALFCAGQSNPNPESVLLAAGAALDDRDAPGLTTLMTAAWGNSNPAMVALLFQSGADAKAKSGSGKTALDYAWDNPSMSAGSDAYQALQEAMK